MVIDNGTSSIKQNEAEIEDCESSIVHFENFLNDGKRAFIAGNLAIAAENLSQAAELSVKFFGDFAAEVYEPHLYYGKTLLDLARLEDDVLSNALQGVAKVLKDKCEATVTEKNGGEEVDGSECDESTGDLSDAEKMEIAEEVGKALEENAVALEEERMQHESVTVMEERETKNDTLIEGEETDDFGAAIAEEEGEYMEHTGAAKAGKKDEKVAPEDIFLVMEEKKSAIVEAIDQEIKKSNDAAAETSSENGKVSNTIEENAKTSKAVERDGNRTRNDEVVVKKGVNENGAKVLADIKSDEDDIQNCGVVVGKDVGIEGVAKVTVGAQSEAGFVENGEVVLKTDEKDAMVPTELKSEKDGVGNDEAMVEENTKGRGEVRSEEKDKAMVKNAEEMHEIDSELVSEAKNKGDNEEFGAEEAKMDESAASTENGNDSEDDEEEEVEQLQLAWETLEVARAVCDKFLNEEGWKAKKVEVLLVLCDCSIEAENYEQAINDINDCMELQNEIKEKNSRRIAQAYFLKGRALSLMKKFDKAAEAFKNVKALLVAKQLLIESTPNEERSAEELESAKNEIDDICTLLPEIQMKIVDAIESARTLDKAMENKEKENVSKMEGMTVKADVPLTDVTDLVRKKVKRSAIDKRVEDCSKRLKTDCGDN